MGELRVNRKLNAISAAPVPPGIAGLWLFLPDCYDAVLLSRYALRGGRQLGVHG